MGSVKEELHLEAAICDIDDIANVCVMLMDILEKNERSAAKMKITAKQAAEHLAYWRDAVSFSVLHLSGMTRAFKKQYLASEE